MNDEQHDRLQSIVDHLERLADEEEANALAGFHRYAEGYANVREAEMEDQGANLQRVYDELQQLRRTLADDFYEQDVHRLLDATDRLLREVDPEIGQTLGKISIGLARLIGRDDQAAGDTAYEYIEQLRQRD